MGLAPCGEPNTRDLTAAELAVIALGAEPDEFVVYVDVKAPAVPVGGQSDVAALGAGGCFCDLGLHG
jgi:hypothetical protein